MIEKNREQQIINRINQLEKLVNNLKRVGISTSRIAEIPAHTHPVSQINNLNNYLNQLDGVVETITGDGVETDFDIEHSQGTRNLIIQVYQNFGDYQSVDLIVQQSDPDNLRLIFDTAPADGDSYVVLIKPVAVL